ncbi:hypothetical protein JXA63_02025 [Candidatus Woesebacteria bacterium]|nr:hypothetical protein [Candidatus Woesebacteria bacterium]
MNQEEIDKYQTSNNDSFSEKNDNSADPTRSDQLNSRKTDLPFPQKPSSSFEGDIDHTYTSYSNNEKQHNFPIKKIVIIAIVATFVLVTSGIFAKKLFLQPDKLNNNKAEVDPVSEISSEYPDMENEVGSQNQTQITTPAPYQTPSSTPNESVTTTPKPTVTQTPTPTVTPQASSNPYDLTSSTGAVKVTISASSGNLVGDQIVELSAQSGYAVLQNMTSEKDTRIARQGSPEVTFSQAPAGPYSVRIQYKGQWTGSKNIIVNSGQLTTTNVTVQGDAPTPTPTSLPTPTPTSAPTCSIVTDTSSGSTPLTVNFIYSVYGGISGHYVDGIQWDFDGDGTWDTDFSFNGNLFHTYTNPGSYTAKMHAQFSNGFITSVCTKPITAQ